MSGIGRRGFLLGMGSATAIGTLSTTVSSASNGDTTYIVVGSGLDSGVKSEKFFVSASLAGGQVALIDGNGTESELLGLQSVSKATQDFSVRFSQPVTQNSASEAGEEPLEEYQWWLDSTSLSSTPSNVTGDGSSVAVIDTGIDASHPDLSENVDEARSVLVKNGTFYSDATDPIGHGTHVAGIIGAAQDDSGVIGAAPDTSLVSLRVFSSNDDGEYTAQFSDILLAIDRAAQLGTDVANLSLGTIPLPPQANAGGGRASVERVASYALRSGTIVVASAGNHGENLQHSGEFIAPSSMASVVGVGATGPNDRRTYYSNYGENEVEIGAPGGGYETQELTFDSDDVSLPYPRNLILSTMSPTSVIGQNYGGADYAFLLGTSMSAPIVSGIAALAQNQSTNSATHVQNILLNESRQGESPQRLGFKSGIVDAEAVLSATNL